MYISYIENKVLGCIEIICDETHLIEININVNKKKKYIENNLSRKVKKQLLEYFNGDRKVFELPLKFEGTDFQKSVWNTLVKIPYGNTKSYKDIAKEINNEKSCRAVGGANNKNPIPIIIPCHRVINKNGSLGGYNGGEYIKRYLLELEKHEK
ncbi:methylated-DNA--[protein]-cysteine S-methyltransferase [Streptobacillus canis]|uniref:methylated-DNA--[protein]-cysteine S-methyltransferase n=1 Tax=Streptobacillus canis TaxID=2678686 RepID=UPI0012E1064D|nr:methylated-DNA--[protein]-cysteine S-methyltransferase [Streptobacillus canis]